eukprot:TRINITY_DN28416_c0_g1_i10.p1 TRINITY_DN28416_c0_g1~~TRINITY_DN28416_c0_g1_i10.p1  ORF type:complete len:301 (-),score=48.59 TRINITY_DN28416_c0_g1_i10:423-1325(-)
MAEIDKRKDEDFDIMRQKLDCTVCGIDTSDSAELTYHYLKHSLLELAQALSKLQVELFARSCLSLPEKVDLKIESIVETKIPAFKSNEEQTKEDPVKPDQKKIVEERSPINNSIENTEESTENTKKKCPSLRPHACDVCHKVLSSRSTLEKHMLLHSGKRPHKCKLCQAEFIQRRSLTCHVMQKHSMERPYKCKICNKGFVYNFYLEEHMIYHTGEKKHQCPECGKRFVSPGALSKHIKRHTTIKSFQCNFCNKMFKVNVDLKTHIKFVHARERLEDTKKQNTEQIEKGAPSDNCKKEQG